MLRPNIFQVSPQDDFTVNVYFDDGKIKSYDAKPLIQKGGIFARLGDADYFKSHCVVLNHTLAWSNSENLDPTDCIDICPDTIYEHATEVRR